MAETTTPIFPCRSIEEIEKFYLALGFEPTFRQTRPNTYLCVRRGDVQLHFFGLKDYDPAGSLHMCYILTTDVDPMYAAFRTGLKAAFGKVQTRGLPRIGPLKDMSYDVRQFLITDPGGNQLRIGQPISDDFEHRKAPTGKIARALHHAALLGESKEDPVAASKILDHLLTSSELTPDQFVQAAVMRADLAVRREEWRRAAELLAEVRAADLTDADRAGLEDELSRAADLEAAL